MEASELSERLKESIFNSFLGKLYILLASEDLHLYSMIILKSTDSL